MSEAPSESRSQQRLDVLKSRSAFPESSESIRRKQFLSSQERRRTEFIERLRAAAASASFYNTEDPVGEDYEAPHRPVKRGGRRNRHQQQQQALQAKRESESTGTGALTSASPCDAPSSVDGVRQSIGIGEQQQRADDAVVMVHKARRRRRGAKSKGTCKGGEEAVEIEGTGPTSSSLYKPGGKTMKFTKRQLSMMKGFSSYLVLPDHMVETPIDLSTEWLCYVRPEGPRSLVLTNNGRAYVRAKNGRFMMDFETVIPPGTILDCVYVKEKGRPGRRLSSKPKDGESMEVEVDHEGEMDDVEDKGGVVPDERVHAVGCFYVIDVLCWNESYLVDTPMECRLFFLRSRMEELQHACSKVSNFNRKPFVLPDTVSCSVDNINHLYHGYIKSIRVHDRLQSSYRHPFRDLGYTKDSLIFVHREAQYVPGLNPLYLCWKDSHLRFATSTLIMSPFPSNTAAP
eukprot:GHVN01106157.1.p1 GENE.GHVN01106157.1~~GHVN01106157.1.p1  ORF type:complete len:458 (+),score=86.39 GHVN01106157.1:297-1670(+)